MNEFVCELMADPARRVFFVEGLRDHAFWTTTLSAAKSNDVVIYQASSVMMEGADGGERGRLMKCAEALSATSVGNRVCFFVDADFDRLLPQAMPPGVIFTDGRDLESYFFLGQCIRHCCATLGPSSLVSGLNDFNRYVRDIIRPIGILRLACQRAKLPLAFQKTLDTKGLARFITSSESLDMPRLISTLLQNTDANKLPKQQDLRKTIGDLFAAESELQSAVPDYQVVHGKDLVRLISWQFDVEDSFAGKFLLLSLASEAALIGHQPNVASAHAWMR